MDMVTLVLESPRGRFFCANVAYACSTDDRAAGYHRPRAPADVLEVIAGVDVRAMSELSERDLLEALAFATDFARYWQPPDEEDIWFASPDVLTALRPIASAVLESPLTQWWSDPVDLDNQRMVGHRISGVQWPESTTPYRSADAALDRWREHVLEGEARFRQWRIERPDNRIGGDWWSIPFPSAATVTSRARDWLGALSLILDEDSSSMGEARVWPIAIHGTPRVYEIDGPTAWAQLVDAYPLAVAESKRSDWLDTTGEVHNWFIPDWAAVAHDFDGVHLTLNGYLTTPGIAVPLQNNDGATVLAGFDPDTTWWLNVDAVHIEDEPTLWRVDDERWVRV